ncbi:MAG: hypothetical protein AB7N65_07675 [Vicinamibacterales bacterium]
MKLDAHVHTHYPHRPYSPWSSTGKIAVGESDAHTGRGIGRTFTVVGGLIGLPLICLPLLGALLHLIDENGFNRSLLVDWLVWPALAQRRSGAVPEAV